jgi:hypothetical protein
MRFFYDNLIDASGVAFTASSAHTNLPATNVANEHRKRVWRTGTSTAAETLVIDLGSAQSVTSIILLDHTLTAADTLIKIQGHTSDSWGAPDVNETLTWASRTISKTFSSATKRYWRLIFTKSAAGETRDIGRIFLGTYYDTTEQPDYDGYDDSLNDPSRKSKSLAGQTYVDVLEKFGSLSVAFSDVGNTQVESLKTIFESVGQSVSFFVQAQTTSPLNDIWYVKATRPFERDVSGFDSNYLWNVKLELEEQL